MINVRICPRIDREEAGRWREIDPLDRFPSNSGPALSGYSDITRGAETLVFAGVLEVVIPRIGATLLVVGGGNGWKSIEKMHFWAILAKRTAEGSGNTNNRSHGQFPARFSIFGCRAADG